MIRRTLTALALLAIAPPAAAQGVSGKWITEFERMIRNDNGDVSASDKARARLTLEQKGDSVFGTWLLLSAPAGAPAPTPRKLTGTIAGEKVTLVSEPTEARVNRNGEEGVVTMTQTYEFTVGADALTGTLVVASSSGMTMPPRPFNAKREKP